MSLYRVPPVPPFAGGTNAGPLLIALLVGLFGCAGTTQYLAAQFGYQAALGTPIWTARSRQFAVYFPLNWVKWEWQFRNVQNPAVVTPLKYGLWGGLAVLVLAFGMSGGSTGRRARKLSRDAQDLHGSAAWATDADVKRTGLLGTTEGVYVGAWRQGREARYLRDDSQEHVLAFAPTGSGKGVGLVIPTMLGWSESAVVYDIKGEVWDATAGWRSECGHLCFRFAPVSQEAGARFNPLAEIRIFTPRDVADARNLALMLVRTGADAAQERYWQDAATAILTGLILHVCYRAAIEKTTASLADLAAAFTPTGMDFREFLVETMMFHHDPEARFGWTTHPEVRGRSQALLNKEDKDFSGVVSTAETCLALYADPLIQLHTSESDFRIRDLVDFETPISLYLVVPPSDEVRLRPLIRLIFTLIVNRLTEVQEENRHRLLFMIDEFPTLHHMEIFASAMSFMRGYGLKAYLIAQDIRQIEESYGKNESIVSNCHIRVAFAPNQIETAQMLSKMVGDRTVEMASYSFSGKKRGLSLDSMNASVNYVERPLLTADEIGRLPGDAALIFATGQRPILGQKIRYYEDPEMLRRTRIPPPTDTLRIITPETPEAEPEPREVAATAEEAPLDWPAV